ncbi:radical SAM protein [Candidatus Desantisbacteria bacterium CG07_land_8_20_14_0_80_39_15]|uniref:Radical SAM protein n=1 Tax=Candidatus Desantisbacteria bacterium CG07_land_8_20_14_0_80_39_15 TaxID=1974549 RepID=A0A2M6ZEM8_9BACT|nr:MAG: radical SAM protein [Candidatus Desantisbacteria bacterium CG07_land_8_20_14_0_80_39_15]
MKKKNFKYIYGPVSSWRLGSSLGIDLLSQKKKICTFGCIYCQVGRTTRHTGERKVYVPSKEILEEIQALPRIKIDYLTFSGRGEPTLAKNLGEIISKLKKSRKEKIAVLTNSSLLTRKKVRKDLSKADFVIVKLDAYSQESFERINKPIKGISLKKILKGIFEFKKEYRSRLGLQIMFMKENKDDYKKIALLAQKISPDEIHINTPLRPCPVKPLSKKEISKIVAYFRKIPAFSKIKIISVYDKKPQKVLSLSAEDTVRRRGKPH